MRRVLAVETAEVFALLCVFFALGALDAYSIGRVPITWVSQLGLIGSAGYVFFRYRLVSPPAHNRLWVFLAWAALITAVNTILGHYAVLMPAGATTPYAVFIGLRFLTILSFIAAVYLIYWLLTRGWRERIIKTIVLLGAAIAVVSFYMYMAQIYGLPEPPRTRLGTSGAAVRAVIFTYDFHRAEGTFREPSLFAAWLVVPFLLSFTISRRIYLVPSVLMGGALFLTGSLSGILSLLFGAAAAAGVAIAFDMRSVRWLLRPLVVVPVALVIFYGFARPSPAPTAQGTGAAATATPIYSSTPIQSASPTPSALKPSPSPTQGVSLFGTLGRRIGNILKGGFAKSDRDRINDYVTHNRPPIFGSGFGNANLLLGHYLHAKVIASFISLYLDALYAAGIIGLALLANYLIAPLRAIRHKDLWRNARLVFVAAAYIAWLVEFAAGTEELTLMFGLTAALFTFEISKPTFAGAALGGPGEYVGLNRTQQQPNPPGDRCR